MLKNFKIQNLNKKNPKFKILKNSKFQNFEEFKYSKFWKVQNFENLKNSKLWKIQILKIL